MRRSPALVLTALLLPAGLAACSDDGSDRLATGDGFSVEAALAELPALPESDVGATVVVYDLAAAAEANDAGERPGEGDELGRWLLTATGTATAEGEDDFPPVFVPPVQLFGSQGMGNVEEIEGELGWSILDVDAVAEIVLPPERFGVVTGDVGEDSFSAAGLEPDDDGIVSVGEGDDGETDPSDTTAARPLGAALRMAADGDRIAVASSTDAVTEWVDGEPETLAEDDDLRGLAAILDDADAIAAYLTTFPEGPDFGAVGIGWSVEDGEARMTMAFAYDDERAAEDGVEAIEESLGGTSVTSRSPLADMVTVDEVEAEGSIVVAHLRPGPEGRPQVPLDMLIRRDGPFAG